MLKPNNTATCYLFSGENETLKIEQFVHEPYPFDCEENEVRSYFYLYLITGGEGVLKVENKTHDLTKNCVFGVFPNIPFKYKNLNSLQFIYVGFSGGEANKIMQLLKLNKENPVFGANSDIANKWKESFLSFSGNLGGEYVAKSLIYSLVAERLQCAEVGKENKKTLGLSIKEYILQNLSDAELSLKKVSEIFHFSYNYTAQSFLKETKISFTKFLYNARMKKAGELLNGKERKTIKEISSACGYQDALYFSREFKRYYGVCPSEFAKKKKPVKDVLYSDFYVLK